MDDDQQAAIAWWNRLPDRERAAKLTGFGWRPECLPTEAAFPTYLEITVQAWREARHVSEGAEHGT